MITPNPGALPPSASDDAAAQPESKSLLIVHDDEEILRRLTMLFNGVYTVAFVETLSQALHLVRQGYRPSVALLPGDLGQADHPFVSGLGENLPDTVLILVFRDAAAARALAPLPVPVLRLSLGRQVPEIIQTVRLAFQQQRLRA